MHISKSTIHWLYLRQERLGIDKQKQIRQVALDPEEMNTSLENKLNVAITEFFIYNSIIQHQIASAKPY